MFVFDFFTISSIIVVVIILITVITIMNRSYVNPQRSYQPINTKKEHTSATARELCKVLCQMYPETCHGFDYLIADEGEGAYIKEWFLPEVQPDKDKLEAAIQAYRAK